MRGAERARDERGAAIVEFGIIASVLFLLLFGIVDWAMTENNIQAVRYGAQEGARQGGTGRTGSTTSCSLQGSATGANTPTQQLICLTKGKVGLDNANTRVMTVLGAGGYTVGSHLVVCVQYPLQSWSGFLTQWLTGKVTQAKSLARIDRLTSPALQPVAEPALSGSNWTWCTA